METKVLLNERLISTLDAVVGKNWVRLSEDTGIAKSTIYRVKDKPSGIDMKQLLALANGLQIPVGRFFCSDDVQQIGRREDYVTEPYLPCRYDCEVMRKMIRNRRDVTWVKGCEYTGMTEDSLKKSILSDDVRVTRFLAFCRGFGIDPFNAIIDPNPKERPKRTAAPVLLTEVAAMRKEIGQLTSSTNDLTEKYQAISDKYDEMIGRYDNLLDAHKLLLRRFNEHLGETAIGFAAEQ